MSNPSKRVALITGSGKKRIGSAIAEMAAARGWDICVHYRTSKNEAEALVQTLRQSGVQAEAFSADVSSEQDVSELVGRTIDRFGRIDLLVTCAATWLRKPLEETTAADVLSEFSTNALGTFLFAQQAGLQMCKQPAGGHIVTIGDWAVSRPYRDYAAYLTSKGAIETLTRTFAVELGERNPNVRVNCIHPGPAMQPESLSAAELQSVANSTLLKRWGSAQAIGEMVFALTENTFVTGAVVPVDGGRSIYAGGR